MDRRFVEWKEKFLCQERGSRVVHYLVKDSAGDSFLAVVGTERSLRHIVYVVADEFLQVLGSNSSCFKWRSRREVVDWLASLVAKHQTFSGQHSRSPLNETDHLSNVHTTATEFDDPGSSSYSQGHFTRKLRSKSDIVWLGVSRMCGRQLKHYSSFSRNGIVVNAHSFVFVMSKDDNHYLAYLEDMYEDKKGKKKVKLRWFHQQQEVSCKVPPPDPHPKEVFITPYFQVISAECVDGVAYVLTPEHYRKCLGANLLNFSARTHLCFRQFSSNGITPFAITKLKGYCEQRILACVGEQVNSEYELACKSLDVDEAEFDHGSAIKGSHKGKNFKGHQQFFAHQSGMRISGEATKMMTYNVGCHDVSFGSPLKRSFALTCGVDNWVPYKYKVNDRVEILCQDSGIRGCWFRCTVLEVARKQLKVYYDDIQDDGDCGNLEEWIPALRLAAPDKLGMRFAGRLTIRPSPQTDGSPLADFVIGMPIDAWWNDGWWEGVVTSIDYGNCVQVYFPGENVFSVFQKEKLRASMDWIGDHWLNITVKPDILSIISAIVPSLKLSACSEAEGKRSDSGGSRLLDRQTSTLSTKPIPDAGDHHLLQDNTKHGPGRSLEFHDNADASDRHSSESESDEEKGCMKEGGGSSRSGARSGGNSNQDGADREGNGIDDVGERSTIFEVKKIKLTDGEDVGSNLLVPASVSS